MIAFFCPDPYERQDTISENSRFILLDISVTNKYDGTSGNMLAYITMPVITFNAIKRYLNYNQQKKDSIIYKLQLNVQRSGKYRNDNEWKLMRIIKIDSVKGIPIRDTTGCEENTIRCFEITLDPIRKKSLTKI